MATKIIPTPAGLVEELYADRLNCKGVHAEAEIGARYNFTWGRKNPLEVVLKAVIGGEECGPCPMVLVEPVAGGESFCTDLCVMVKL